MMKLILRFCFLVMLVQIAPFCNSQVKMTDLTSTREGELLFSFPLITHKKKIVADKVNLHLQKEILEKEIIVTDSVTIFEEARFVSSDTGVNSGWLSYISFQEELNTSSVLSLSFIIESMGAYPETFPRYYNFNLENGDLLKLNDIITSEGVKAVTKIVLNARKKMIDEQLASLATEISADELKYAKETFRECNKSADVGDFYMNVNGIRFYKYYCFPHVARAYDTLLDVFIPYAELTNFLTPTGKKILLEIK